MCMCYNFFYNNGITECDKKFDDVCIEGVQERIHSTTRAVACEDYLVRGTHSLVIILD